MRLGLIVLCILSWSESLLAQSVIDLKTINESHLLTPQQMAIYVDVSAQKGLKEVLSVDSFKLHQEYIFVANTQANYWVKVELEGNSQKKFVFEILTPQTEIIQFYTNSNLGLDSAYTGHLLSVETREYQHKNFVFDLPINGEKQVIYLQIRSKNKVGFFFKIHPQEQFTNYALLEYWLLGCYYGILILLIVYHLILYFSLKKLVYLFYSLTVVIAGLISSSDDGLGVMYLWQNHREWSQFLGLYVLPFFYLLAFSLYSYTFLGSRFKPLQKKIIWAVVLYLCLFVIHVFLSREQVYFSWFYALPFVLFYLIFLYCFIRFSYRPAFIFLIGFSFSLFGLLVNQLRLLQWIEGNIFTVYAFNIGVVLEFLSMALSLSYRYKEQEKNRLLFQEKELKMMEERNLAQKQMLEAIEEKEKNTREINQTLEIKVQERTTQLGDLITKLKDINYEYDKENWELKRVVKKEKQANFKQENLSLKEIRELFPSNRLCLKFLAEIKWKSEEAYVCYRCGHNNYSVNQETYARKCSRCATTHSATKDSLFHSLKLPLNKLFYVTYLWSKNEQINVKALADDLEISELSLYKFLNKLKERKKLLIKEKKIYSSWVDLVFD